MSDLDKRLALDCEAEVEHLRKELKSERQENRELSQDIVNVMDKCGEHVGKIQHLGKELEKWRREALRQYPTPEAYDAACNALNKCKQELEESNKSALAAAQALAISAGVGEDLLRERDSLSAYVVRMSEWVAVILAGATTGNKNYPIGYNNVDSGNELLNETPAKSLQSIITKAKEEERERCAVAVEDAWAEYLLMPTENLTVCDAVDAAINTIRNLKTGEEE